MKNTSIKSYLEFHKIIEKFTHLQTNEGLICLPNNHQRINESSKEIGTRSKSDVHNTLVQRPSHVINNV